jgi:hypothetical protein
MKLTIGLGILALVLVGCASTGRKLDTSKVAQIKKDVTTREQVIQLVGAPDQMTANAEGIVTFHYTYVRATAKPIAFVPVVGLFAGGADVQNQTLMVMFGTNGIVRDFVSSYGATDLNTGLGTGGTADVKAAEFPKRGR